MSTTPDQGQDTVPHPRYTASNRKAYGSQREVTDAWVAGLYPTHNVDRHGIATLYSSPNFEGEQRPDGSGVLRHYGTREAIRTSNGLVIDNHQCWAAGFAHCSPPDRDQRDAVLPLDAMPDVMNDCDTVFDIVDVHGDRPYNGVVAVIDGKHGDRYGVYAGYDASSWRGNRNFIFRLSEDELDIPVDEIPERLLTPEEVRESDREVITSTTFSGTRLTGDALDAHKDAGGTTRTSQSRWRNYEINMAQYRADLQGKVIVRQGEWFFIPEPDADPAEQGTSYAADKLGSHRATRFHGARSPAPQECDECGATSLAMDEDGEVTCNECGRHVPRPIYVRGQIRHTGRDHRAINLGETWHRAVTHDRDVMTYDDSPGRGMGTRGGWD